MSLQSKTFVCPADDDYPLAISAKCYTLDSGLVATGNDSITLVCLHSTSFHKETWEPTLECLFRIAVQRSSIKIREAWAIECPNHGASAALNDGYFRLPANSGQFGTRKYGQAAHRFMCKKFGNLSSRNDLVLIGHSLGAVASCFLRVLEPRLNFRSYIVIEPVMTPLPSIVPAMNQVRRRSVAAAYERRDVWPSREHARRNLESSGWDSRVLELFLKHGLREHPAGSDPRMPYKGVTLACSREEEAGMYKDIDGPLDSVPLLRDACKSDTVHIIFGETPDFVPAPTRQVLCDPSSKFDFDSICVMKGLGHTIPQKAPERLAHEIYRALSAPVRPKPKI